MSTADPDWLILRRAVPVVLGNLVRRYGHFAECEDAVQEAVLAAVARWPADGGPSEPAAWLTTVASRRLTDLLRSDEARRRRERADAGPAPSGASVELGDAVTSADDSVRLLFLCCHQSLSAPSQVALTLRAVAGLTTAEIASAFLVPEATMAQRISRAKQRVRGAGATFEMPGVDERDERLRSVLKILYLLFNEGYTASAGARLVRAELTAEAVRLARLLHQEFPEDGEVAGLLALMLLTDARREARTGPGGALIPLAEQDRGRWDHDAIAEGVELIVATLASRPVGPYQLQAAIAAVHAEAKSPESTDWPQILALYDLLARVAPSPVVDLNRAVAVGMVDGPSAGLAALEEAATDARVAGSHRFHSVRAHLLELAGEPGAARRSYEEAARRTNNSTERQHLLDRASRLTVEPPAGDG